jgi:hypothetical protein
MGYGFRSSQPGRSTFPYASYTTSGSRPRALRTTAKAVTQDASAELPPFGIQRGAPVAEPNRLQPGEPVTAAGTAEENRPPVAHQLAVAAGEDRRAADQTRSLLLATPCRVSSDEAAVRKHAVQDRGTVITSGVGEPQGRADFGDRGKEGRKSVGGIGRRSGSFGLWDSPER